MGNVIPAQDLQLDPRRHIIVHTGIEDALNEELGTDDFLTYWHAEHQHFVLAKWADEGQGLVTEYPLIFDDIHQVTRDDLDRILYFFSPAYDDDLRKAAQKTKSDFRSTRYDHVDRQRYLADRRKYINRKTHERFSPAQLLQVCW